MVPVWPVSVFACLFRVCIWVFILVLRSTPEYVVIMYVDWDRFRDAVYVKPYIPISQYRSTMRHLLPSVSLGAAPILTLWSVYRLFHIASLHDAHISVEPTHLQSLGDTPTTGFQPPRCYGLIKPACFAARSSCRAAPVKWGRRVPDAPPSVSYPRIASANCAEPPLVMVGS